jgi:hypothetical protein
MSNSLSLEDVSKEVYAQYLWTSAGFQSKVSSSYLLAMRKRFHNILGERKIELLSEYLEIEKSKRLSNV